MACPSQHRGSRSFHFARREQVSKGQLGLHLHSHPRLLPHKKEEEQEEEVTAFGGLFLRCSDGKNQSSVFRSFV